MYFDNVKKGNKVCFCSCPHSFIDLNYGEIYYIYLFSRMKGFLNFDILQVIGMFLLLRRDFRYNPEDFFLTFYW